MKTNKIEGASWDSLFLTFAKVMTMIFGIVLSKILSTGLSLLEYGTYSQANLITSVGTSAILLGLPDAVNYYFNKKTNDSNDTRIRIINTVFFIEIVAGVILAICIVAGTNIIELYFNNYSLHVLLPIVAVLPVLANLIYFYQMLYVASGKAKLMSIYNLVLMVMKIISALMTVYVFHNIVWIYVVLLLLDLIQIVLFKLTLTKQDVRVTPLKFSANQIRPILEYSLPMGVYALTSILNRDLDKLVIGRIAGTESLAIYTNCSKILPFDFLAVSFATVLIPYIVKYVTEENKSQTIKLFSGYIKIGYYSVWILGAAVLIAPSTMIRFLYAEEYVAGLSIFIIYIFDSMLRFASMHLILTAANKTKHLMYYSLLALGLNLVLNIVFYHLWGMIGPAIATLIVSIVYTGLVLSKTIKTINIKWLDVFDVKEIAYLLATIAIFATGAAWLNNILVGLGVNQYLSMIVAMGVFGCIMLLLHAKKVFGVLKEINSFRL